MDYNQIIKFEIVEDFHAFRKLHAVWNALLEQSSIDKVFMTHEWFTVWWQAFGEGKDLFIILARHNGDIIGIAPLMIHKSKFRGMPVRRIKFMENDDSPGCGFIIKEGREFVMDAILSFLMGKVKKWDIIFLRNIPYNEKTFNSILVELKRSGRKYIANNGLNSPFIKIGGDWNEYFGNISTKSKKTIRNICNRMKKLGNIEIKELKNTENYDDIISITQKGWKYKEGLSFINRKDRAIFFHLLSDISQKKKWLSLWTLYHDGKPVAYEYHLNYRDNNTALLAEYNPEYKNYSPGAFLDFEVIKSLFNNGISVYDMCGIQDEYKQKWTSDIRDLKNITIFNNSIYPGLLFFVEKKMIPVFKKVRKLLVW